MTTVVAANIPHSLTPNQATHDSRLAFSLGEVVLACEVDSSNDGPFENAAASTGRRVFFKAHRTQVAVPASWRNAVPRYRTLTDGLRGVNPPRGMAAVFDGDNTWYVSLHLPNGKRNPAKSHRWWRQLQWNRYQQRAAAKIAHWVGNGRNVVAGGDTNDPRGLFLHPNQVPVAHAGLMWLYAIPARGHRVHVTDDRVVRDNAGDHPQIRANVTFTPSTQETR